MAEQALYIPKFDTKHANAELRKKGGEWFWVRMPTSMDSLSRKRLMTTAQGREAFTVYVHLVELAAKDQPRGWLADERGPFTLEDISLKTVIPKEVIQGAVQVLCDRSIGWVLRQEWNGNEIPAQAGHSSSNSISNSSKEEKDARFDEFWDEYPRKVGRAEAKRRWARLDCDSMADQVLIGLRRCKASRDWKGRDAKFLPYPATWLNAEGWSDEPDSGDTTASSRAKAAAWESLGSEKHAELLREVREADPRVDHRPGNTDTERAMRKLAKKKGWL